MKKTYQVLNSIKYNFENGEMVSFTCYFVNGDSGTPTMLSELKEKEVEGIKEYFKEEYNCHQREERRKRRALELAMLHSESGTQNENRIKSGVCRYNTSNPVLTDVIRHEKIEMVQRAICKLLPDQQELIRLAYFEDMKQSDIAKQYNTSASNISHKIKRAETRLKKLLA